MCDNTLNNFLRDIFLSFWYGFALQFDLYSPFWYIKLNICMFYRYILFLLIYD